MIFTKLDIYVFVVSVLFLILFFGTAIGGVMFSVLASSVVDRGFEPRSGQTKDYKIGICCLSAKHTALRRKSNDRIIIIICPSGATCLPTDYCVSELAL